MIFTLTHYFNAFLDEEATPRIEGEALYTTEEVLENIIDTGLESYAYTIEVSNGEASCLDLYNEAENYSLKHDEYEDLTGHELGVAAGKV